MFTFRGTFSFLRPDLGGWSESSTGSSTRLHVPLIRHRRGQRIGNGKPRQLQENYIQPWSPEHMHTFLQYKSVFSVQKLKKTCIQRVKWGKRPLLVPELSDIVCCAHDGGFLLQRLRQQQLMTAYFHVPYRGSISERCRWARQSTTRTWSFEQSFIWFTISLLLKLGREEGGMRIWWSMHLDHRGKREKKKQDSWLIDNSCFVQKEVCALERACKYGSG